MATILLTGSTGYLGTRVEDRLGNRHEIVGLSRGDPRHPVDILDSRALRTLFESVRPHFVIHAAAVVDHHASGIGGPNIEGTRNIVELAMEASTPLIFSSSESVYGGKEQEGNYVETDPYRPRNEYGRTRADSEKIVIDSGLPHLITRGHRYVGVSNRFISRKQFPDTIRTLLRGDPLHLDAHRLFRPTFLDHLIDTFDYFIEHDSTAKVIVNVGVDRVTTYFDFICDIAVTTGIPTDEIYPDGQEMTWPDNSTLSLEHAKSIGYPMCSYEDGVQSISNDLRNVMT